MADCFDGLKNGEIMKNTLLWLVAALPFALPSRADVIQGVVTSSADSSRLSQVKVSSDSTHFTFTGADGSFTLTTDAGTGIRGASFQQGFDVRWNPEQRAFSWGGYS